jgi:hypothetical protein
MQRHLPFLAFIFFLFITMGDQVLPDPLGKASTQTRTAFTQALSSLWPSWKPRTDPYGRTEDAIDQENK